MLKYGYRYEECYDEENQGSEHFNENSLIVVRGVPGLFYPRTCKIEYPINVLKVFKWVRIQIVVQNILT